MWYHVTKSYRGKVAVMTPRLPRDGNSNLIKYEGNIPRICVSNDIFRCLLAIHGTEELVSDKLYFTENPCVYYTEVTPYLPPDYGDFRINNEMWFLKRTKFYYLARVDLSKLFRTRIIVPTFERTLKLLSQRKIVRRVTTEFISRVMGANGVDEEELNSKK